MNQNEPMQPSALRFHRLAKSYGGTAALADFDLQVAAGECFGLVGANGAGKTTLIKCLLDFCECDSGEIDIFGVPHHQTTSRARLAYLPERFNPPHYLTGRDFLQFMAKMHCVTYEERAANDMAHALDLDPTALDKPVRAYSKGMNQKLGLAACLMSNKDLLLLDEPTSGLDPRARASFKHQIKALHQAGKTIFFTSHALADVEEMCSRVAVIDGGRLRFVGTPAELTVSQHAATLEQAFLTLIGAPASVVA